MIPSELPSKTARSLSSIQGLLNEFYNLTRDIRASAEDPVQGLINEPLPRSRQRVTVFDVSALLAFSRHEPGAQVVGPSLSSGYVSAVNASEFVQKLDQYGDDGARALELLEGLGLRVCIRPTGRTRLQQRRSISWADRSGYPWATGCVWLWRSVSGRRCSRRTRFG